MASALSILESICAKFGRLRAKCPIQAPTKREGEGKRVVYPDYSYLLRIILMLDGSIFEPFGVPHPISFPGNGSEELLQYCRRLTGSRSS